METPKVYNNAIRPECFARYGEGWERPTGAEVRHILSLAGLTGSQAANLVGVSTGRTIRKWVGDETPIPYAAWAILSEAAGFGLIWK